MVQSLDIKLGELKKIIIIRRLNQCPVNLRIAPGAIRFQNELFWIHISALFQKALQKIKEDNFLLFEDMPLKNKPKNVFF